MTNIFQSKLQKKLVSLNSILALLMPGKIFKRLLKHFKKQTNKKQTKQNSLKILIQNPYIF